VTKPSLCRMFSPSRLIMGKARIGDHPTGTPVSFSPQTDDDELIRPSRVVLDMMHFGMIRERFQMGSNIRRHL
jgi:hypothetical protein